VPDASRYFEGEDAPFQEFSPEHINFFGPISLTNLSIINGFKLVALERNLVEVSYRTYTPIINAIFQKTNEISVITLDNETEPGLIAYIERSNQIDNYLHSIISEIANSGRQIVVWGTGSHTLRLLASTRLKEANILAFVDSNPRYQGKDLHGIPIVSPQSLDREAGEILISSRVYQREIEEQIRSDLRLDNKIITLYAIDM
jgi:FlaA1/EpsC-like NDP-sugar epimerase